MMPARIFALVAALGLGALASAAETATSIEMNPPAPSANAVAVLGGGCFWCVEAVYERLPGVLSVESGYAGGHVDRPSYEAVCSGETGHAEVVRITYDPAKVGYRQLVDLFWAAHDPTTLNRQGADEGPQYRSILFYASEEEKTAALASRDAAQARFSSRIVTEIVPLARFWPAEGHHQDYFNNHRSQPYCRHVIQPKVEKLQKQGLIGP